MRISSIDIGSNAIRQVIVEINPDGTWVILKKHRETIRLGSDVFALGAIQDTTLTKLIAAFKRMAKNNRKYKVDRSLAFATSAFRDAQNKKPILTAIARASGVRIQIISGQKEAELIRLAVQKAIGPASRRNYLLIDIGGGSVELTHLEKQKIHYSKSFKWGMVRTMIQAQKAKKSTIDIVKANLKKHGRELPKGPFEMAVGTGGNLDAIAKLKLRTLKKGPNTLVTQDELVRIYQNFQKTPALQRAERFDLRPDRIDVIEPAIYLTLELMKRYKIKKLKIPGTGLKDGAILSLL